MHFQSLFLHSPSDSAICSPISALMPLGKLALGAVDQTKTELFHAIGVNKLSQVLHIYIYNFYTPSVLGLILTLFQVKSHFKKLIHDLRDVSGVTISICSGIYVSENAKIKSKFGNDAQSVFGTGIEQVDFSHPNRAAEKINAWVKFYDKKYRWLS